MFEHGRAVLLPAVSSRREGWHPRPLESIRSLAALDPAALSADEALSALETLQRERASLDALEAQLLVRAAGAQRVTRDVLVDADLDDPTVPGRRVEIVDEVVEEIAVTLHRAPGAMRTEVDAARLLHGPLRRTRDLLAAGDITAAHARAIVEQARRLRPDGPATASDDTVFADRCDRLQERVLSHARHETVSEVRQRARRVVVSIDPDGAAARRRRARCTREVRGWAEDDGIGVVMARLAATDAAWIVAAVDAHARAHADDGTFTLDCDATWGEVRAAAFVDLLRNRSSNAAPAGIELQITVGLDTLTGLAPNAPASVQVGSGEPADVDREDLLDLLADTATPVAIRRLVCDPLTGGLIDLGARRYVPGADLVAWVEARDRTCRFPGCRRRACRCDIDHATDFRQGGRTTVANTGLLCRRHHNLKTHGRWCIEDAAPDGSCTFVSPTGRRFRHEVEPLREVSGVPDPDPPPERAPF